MSTHPNARLSRRRARAILDRQQAGDDALSRLLAAAAAVPEPGESAAELAALAQFRAHAPRLAPPTRRTSMIKSMLTKVVAAKILAGTAVAAATGGVALAAADGHFSPHSRLAAPATASSSAQPTDPAASDSSPDASPTVPSVPPADGTSTSATAGTSGAATPSPSLRGLCNAYLAGVADSHGKALQNPAFTVLINAAGGSDGVSGYCATLLAATPGTEHGKPSTHPAHPTHPVYPTHPAKPTQAQSTHPAHPTHPAPTHSNRSGGNGHQPSATPTGTATS